MNFGKLQLNEEVKKKLAASVDSGTLSHAVLLTGGTEKERKDLAVLLAQALLCEADEKPCLKCVSCKKIKAGIHPDVSITQGEAGKPLSIKIETIREIRSRAYIMPNEAPFQIFIILEASGMGEVQQDALLKILEEPPQTARFILTTRSRDDLRQTILSRVTAFAVSEDSGQAAGEKENPKAAQAAISILTSLLSRNEYRIILSAGALEKDRKRFKSALEKMILLLRDAAVFPYKPYVGDNEKLVAGLAGTFTQAQLLAMQDELKTLIADADKNANENLLLTRLAMGLTACFQ